MIRILLVDDSSFMRKVLKQLIESEEEYRVVAEAQTAEDALNISRKEELELILMDISLDSEDDGIKLIDRIRKEGTQTPVLTVSMHEEAHYANKLRQAGAQGFLMKQNAFENIIPAIRRVSLGYSYWPETGAA